MGLGFRVQGLGFRWDEDWAADWDWAGGLGRRIGRADLPHRLQAAGKSEEEKEQEERESEEAKAAAEAKTREALLAREQGDTEWEEGEAKVWEAREVNLSSTLNPKPSTLNPDP